MKDAFVTFAAIGIIIFALIGIPAILFVEWSTALLFFLPLVTMTAIGGIIELTDRGLFNELYPGFLYNCGEFKPRRINGRRVVGYREDGPVTEYITEEN